MSRRIVRISLALVLGCLVLGLVLGGGGHTLTHSDAGDGGNCVLCHALVFDLPGPPCGFHVAPRPAGLLRPGDRAPILAAIPLFASPRAPPFVR